MLPDIPTSCRLSPAARSTMTSANLVVTFTSLLASVGSVVVAMSSPLFSFLVFSFHLFPRDGKMNGDDEHQVPDDQVTAARVFHILALLTGLLTLLAHAGLAMRRSRTAGSMGMISRLALVAVSLAYLVFTVLAFTAVQGLFMDVERWVEIIGAHVRTEIGMKMEIGSIATASIATLSTIFWVVSPGSGPAAEGYGPLRI